MPTDTLTSANGDSAPPIPDAGLAAQEFAAVCPQCSTKARWKGAITEDMIARTFTRGIDADTAMPNCPHCGTPMQIPTGVSAAEAIADAAAAMPEAVEGARQLHIPGLRPVFNYESAFASIIEQRGAVRRAEAVADSKHKDASKAKKSAEEEQEKLSTLEDEFADRAAEVEAEAKLTPAEKRRRTCAFERATGTPCPVCGDLSREITAEQRAADTHVAEVARELAFGKELRPADLAVCLERVAGLVLDRGEIERWATDEMHEVATWLDLPDKVGYPKVLGRAHIVGLNNICRTCGVSLYPLAEARGLDAWPADTKVGTDCAPPSKKRARKPAQADVRTERIREMLAEAGATVSAAAIDAWTSTQKLEAIVWAEEQVVATAKAKPGYTASVRWPDHVSAAHHEAPASRSEPPVRDRTKPTKVAAKKPAKKRARGR